MKKQYDPHIFWYFFHQTIGLSPSLKSRWASDCFYQYSMADVMLVLAEDSQQGLCSFYMILWSTHSGGGQPSCKKPSYP